VEGAVDDHDVGDTARDGECGLLHGRAGAATAVRDPAEELQLGDTECARDRDLGIGLHGEQGEAVHLLDTDLRVGECGEHRLTRELPFAATGVLGELGGSDPGDRCGSRETSHAHRIPFPYGSTTTSPETWTPRLLRPW